MLLVAQGVVSSARTGMSTYYIDAVPILPSFRQALKIRLKARADGASLQEESTESSVHF